ncbi:hypothetical protein B0H11DRAFT_538155, partial [Mycena galericulata]
LDLDSGAWTAEGEVAILIAFIRFPILTSVLRRFLPLLSVSSLIRSSLLSLPVSYNFPSLPTLSALLCPDSGPMSVTPFPSRVRGARFWRCDGYISRAMMADARAHVAGGGISRPLGRWERVFVEPHAGRGCGPARTTMVDAARRRGRATAEELLRDIDSEQVRGDGRTQTPTCGAALHGRSVLNPSLAPCTRRWRWARGLAGPRTMFLRKLVDARHGLVIRPRCRLDEL